MGGDPERGYVLIVDDEAAVLETLRYALEPDLHVLTASTPEEALRLLADRDDIAAMVSDMRMPGMTGIELCERVRALRPAVRRYVLTGYPDYPVAVDSMNRGIVHHFQVKPPRVDELRELLRADVERARSAARRPAEQSDGQATLAGVAQAGVAHNLRKYREALDAHVRRLAALSRRALAARPGTAAVPALSAEIDLAIEQLQSSVGFLDDLVAELDTCARDASRLGAEHPHSCDAVTVARTVCNVFGPQVEETATLTLSVPEEPARVPISRTALGHVILNLIRNAIDAVAERGADRAAIEVTVRRDADRVLVEVGDTGPGIAPEDVDRIFERSFTRKPSGTGLGLAMAHQLAAAAGAKITARDRPAGGALLVVDLPAEKTGE